MRWLEPLRLLRRREARWPTPALDAVLERRSNWHFDSWTRLEERWGVRSALYFVAHKGSLLESAIGEPGTFYDVTSPCFRDAFRRLVAAGAEIRLHASYRAFKSELRFAAEKARLEQAVERTVGGNRYHHLHLDRSRPEDLSRRGDLRGETARVVAKHWRAWGEAIADASSGLADGARATRPAVLAGWR